MDAALIMKVLAYAAANAPAAIQTFGQLKTAVVDGFEELSGSFSDDTTLADLRAGVLKDMDEIKANSDEIQAID